METYKYIFLKLLHIKISSIERIKEILIVWTWIFNTTNFEIVRNDWIR